MKASYNSIAASLKVELSVTDLPPASQAALLHDLLEKSGLMTLILEQGKDDEAFMHAVDVAFEEFKLGRPLGK